MMRALALLVVLALAGGRPAAAADETLSGVWRGTVTVENPRAQEPRIETKAALHLLDGADRALFVERLGRPIPVTEYARNPNGTLDVYAGSGTTLELRNIKVVRDRFEASAILESDNGVVWQGRGTFARVKPLAAPSGRPDCAAAPATLAPLCGTWSGISLRGQPKLLVIDSVRRNKQKVAWELKAKQVWGGESDLASAGMAFPYTIYLTDEDLPLAALSLRTTGKLAYRFEVSPTELVGGSLTDSADRTVYTRAVR